VPTIFFPSSNSTGVPPIAASEVSSGAHTRLTHCGAASLGKPVPDFGEYVGRRRLALEPADRDRESADEHFNANGQ
jgi:hypothetical protein